MREHAHVVLVLADVALLTPAEAVLRITFVATYEYMRVSGFGAVFKR